MKRQIFLLIILCTIPLLYGANLRRGDIIYPVEEWTQGLSASEVELFIESIFGNEAGVAQLIAEGVNINIRNVEGWTPLMLAGCNGHTEVCKILLEASADVNERDIEGYSVFDYALLSNKVSTCKLFLDAGIEVNEQDNEGKTFLMRVAEWSNGLPLCKLLIEYGADPEIKNNYNERALECVQRVMVLNTARAFGFIDEFAEEDFHLILESVMDHSSLYVFLDNPDGIHNVILQGDHPRIRRLRRDSSNIWTALMAREFGK